MKIVNEWSTKACGKLGRLLAWRPDYFILIPIFLTAFLSTYLYGIDYNRDLFQLFTPKNGRAMKDRERVKEIFGRTATHDMSRALDLPILCATILVCKDGGSILRKEMYHEVLRVNELVQNVSAEYEGRTYRFSDLCDKQGGDACYNSNFILDISDPRLERLNNGKSDIMYPLKLEIEELIIEPMGFQLGGVKLDDRGFVKEAESIILLYFLNATKFDPKAFAWGKAYTKLLRNLGSDKLDAAVFTWRAMEDGFEDMILIALLFFVGTLAVMIAFTFLTSSSSNGIPWLGFLGCVSAILAQISAFGFATLIGYELISVAVVVPFLMLGIGMDDTFILLASWRKTSVEDSVSTRLCHTFEHAGTSITISSLTTFASFIVGTFVIFPGVKIFCVYIATATAFTYLYHLTFFGGCVATVGYIRKAFKPGNWPAATICCMKEINPGYKKVEDHFLMRFFRDTFSVPLNDPMGQIAVILVYLTTIATGLYGFTYYTEGMRLQRLITYDHYLVKFFNRFDKYYRVYPYRIQVIVNGEMDYGDPKVRDSVNQLLNRFEASPFISDDKRLTESWLRAYQYALDSPLGQMLGITCEGHHNASFGKCIKDLMDSIPVANYFSKDFAFAETDMRIMATRHVIQSHLINDTVDEKHMVQELRRIAEASELDVIVYNSWFLFFDQFVYMKRMAVISLSSAIVIVIVVSFLFIPHTSCTIWIGISSVSIFVTCLGYLSFWGVSMDMVGLVGLIMCIGFSVDYAFHISFAYVTAPEATPGERLRSALYTMGMPILQSSVSTLLGVSVLCFIPSYCFSAFIRTVFLVIGLGTVHGLFFLPVFFVVFENLVSKPRLKLQDSKPIPEQQQITVFSVNKLSD